MHPTPPSSTPRPDVKYIVDILRRLIGTPSPAGHTEAAIRLLEHELDRLGVRHGRTHRGALVASCPGREAGPHRTFAGHVDTLAAMVKEIDRGGSVRFTQIGGYAPGTIEGEYCSIETCGGGTLRGTVLYEKPSAHVSKDVASARRETENLLVRVDVAAATPEDLRAAGVSVGDYIHFDPRFELTDSGFVKSRHLDDKTGVACMLGALAAQTVAHLRPRRTTHYYFSTSEEVGFGASSGIPEGTGQLIAVDMGAVGKGQESDEFSVAICAKDSTGPFDYRLRQRLTEVCRQHDIPHRIDVYPHYGSDAAAALRAGADVVTGLIGPGISASHSMERTHRRALDATARLIIAFSELA
jgi:putative aminopeptidase FrvX